MDVNNFMIFKSIPQVYIDQVLSNNYEWKDYEFWIKTIGKEVLIVSLGRDRKYRDPRPILIQKENKCLYVSKENLGEINNNLLNVKNWI